jgi:putative membrane protein
MSAGKRESTSMKIERLLATLAGATAIAFALPALAADTAQGFVDKATVGGLFEVESSKLADTAAQDATVKDFAHIMVTDHTAANTKLGAIASEQQLDVPGALDTKHQAILDKLNAAKGGSFDQAYVQVQRDAHDEAVSLFEDYAQDGDNASLKTFATETLPTLKMHQDKVEAIAKTMGSQPATTGASDNTGATHATDSAAPVAGANSFTEDQAKSRIQDAGYSEVSGLAKDDNGIWRAQAKKDGKNMPVALDYQGNVTSQAN